MHKQGDPEIMNLEPVYEQAALDVFDYLAARVEACLAAGIARERLIVDPGIGFGKRGAHNLDILRSLTLYHALGCPVLLGVSRKGLTGELERQRPPEERLAGSIAAAVWALDQGVQILRVHDVAETRQALDVWERLVGLA
jgi:dihydropteroate synthase